MLPFSIGLKLGLPVTEQIVFSVKKAVLGGQLQPGDKFPSVRVLSQELRISPNTAHKAIASLVDEGVLVATPAVGTSVAPHEAGDRKDCAHLLGAEVERLVVEAKNLGIEQEDVQAAVVAHWEKLETSDRKYSHK